MSIQYYDFIDLEQGRSSSIHESASVPFDYQRLPRSRDYLCSLSAEGMAGTLDYNLYLAHPNKTRKCWSIWCVIENSCVEFIYQRTAACPVAYIKAEPNDDPIDIARLLLLAGLEVLEDDSKVTAPENHREAYYHSISAGLLNKEQVCAALLTAHTGFGGGMHDPGVETTQTTAIVDATFPEFQERVTERLDVYLAGKG